MAGLPRSGTTWTARVLAQARDSSVVIEPDNEKLSALALWAKSGLGRFPVLGPLDEARRYRSMWSWALGGALEGTGGRIGRRILAAASESSAEAAARGEAPVQLRVAGGLASFAARSPSWGAKPPAPRAPGSRVIAKSVHACLALEWLTSRFDLDVLVVLRDPANVLASWVELDLPDADRGLERNRAVQERYVQRWSLPEPGASRRERIVWQLGLLTAALVEAADRNPGWLVRTHESLCADPKAEFMLLYQQLGLQWGQATEEFLEASDRSGSGFSLERRSADMTMRWKSSLEPSEVSEMWRVLSRFPLGVPFTSSC